MRLRPRRFRAPVLMLRKLQYVCLAGSIGLVGADRIDLLAGKAPFTLTPFLILAPLLVLSSLLSARTRDMLRLTITPPMRRQFPFVASASLFLIFTFASIPFSLDPERSIVAFCDLLIVTVLAYYISLRVLAEPDKETLIVRAVTFALIMYVIFCVGEFIAWTHGMVIDAQRSGTWLQSTFAPGSLGPWAPALSGTTFDANRSGFILTMYLVLLDKFAPKARITPLLRYAIGILVLLAFSRSASLCWLAYYLFSPSFWRQLATRRVMVRMAAIAVLGSVFCVVYQRQIFDLAEAWEVSDAISTKLSMDPGTSGESHILLIERGFQTWLTSSKTIVMGIGFAAAPKVLEDFFGTDKHGNFHSLYVTALAEMGFPAFLILMFILTYPIFDRKGTLACVAAVMTFNISYQAIMEPAFWLILALLWSYERRERLSQGYPTLIPQTGD